MLMLIFICLNQSLKYFSDESDFIEFSTERSYLQKVGKGVISNSKKLAFKVHKLLLKPIGCWLFSLY